MHSPTPTNQWTGRIDVPATPQSLRYHQVVQVMEADPSSGALLGHDTGDRLQGFGMVGYAVDEGVRRNQGRVGAKDGPNAFRKGIASMAYHSDQPLYDLGDIQCPDQDLENAQRALAKLITWSLSQGLKPIAVGGGHDIAFGHYQGIKAYLAKQGDGGKLGIINLDAHYDLRDPSPQPSSGSPFEQIAQELGKDHFNYLCIGIHEYANTQTLFDRAEAYGVQTVMRDELRADFQAATLKVERFVQSVDHLYLTIDLDGFDHSLAIGVSAPSVDGLLLGEVLPIVGQITSSGKLLSMDLAELNPTFDLHGQTARLAAYLAHFCMKHWRY